MSDLPFNPDETCPCCGRRTFNKHTLSPCLVGGLFELAIAKGTKPANIRELRFDRTTWDNFQKLRYWGLVQHHGPAKSGVWSVTARGMAFLRNKYEVRKWAFTRERGKVMGYDGDLVNARTASRSKSWVYRYDDYEGRLPSDDGGLLF